MLGAFAWGFLAASSLIVGGAVALRYRIGNRALGLVMAFGSGVLISAVAFELVQEAFDTAGGSGTVALGLFVGSCVFFAGDALIDRMGGEHRKHAGGRQAHGSAPAIVLGLTIVTGGTVSAAFLVAVALSNLPEAVAATTGLSKGGWGNRPILGLWVLVTFVSGLAALLGFAVFDSASAGATAFVLAFAGGAILTMLADTMMPEAFEHAGPLVGLVTTLGFAVAYGLSALE